MINLAVADRLNATSLQIKLNNTLPYLVSNIVEVLEVKHPKDGTQILAQRFEEQWELSCENWNTEAEVVSRWILMMRTQRTAQQLTSMPRGKGSAWSSKPPPGRLCSSR